MNNKNKSEIRLLESPGEDGIRFQDSWLEFAKLLKTEKQVVFLDVPFIFL